MSGVLQRRFGSDDPALHIPDDAPQSHILITARGVMRSFDTEPVPLDLLHRLCALALCSPTKSDLQQRDIVIVEEPARARINELLSTGPLAQDWIPSAPAQIGRAHV